MLKALDPKTQARLRTAVILSRRMSTTRLVLAVAVAVSFAGASASAQPVEATDQGESPQKKIPMVDKAHAGVSNGVLASANWLDSFFSDERVEAEQNRTRLKVALNFFSEEGEGLEFDPRINLRLVLPRFNNRLQLELARESEEDLVLDSEDPLVRRSVRRRRFEDMEERDFTAALRYFVKATRRANISMSAGLRIRGGIPVGLFGPRLRQEINLKPWTLRFTQRLLWFTDTGLESNTRLDLERPLPMDLFFRTSAGFSWFEDRNNYFYDLRFLLFQPLSAKRSLGYEWNNFFELKDPNNHLEETNLRLRYRQRIWRDWLFFEVAPQLGFPKDRDFDLTPGILLRLDMFFGGKKALEDVR